MKNNKIIYILAALLVIVMVVAFAYVVTDGVLPLDTSTGQSGIFSRQ